VLFVTRSDHDSSVEGASFNNFLDAIDGSYCTYEGGDDPTQDGIYPDQNGTAIEGAYKGPESCGIAKPPYVVSTVSLRQNVASCIVFKNGTYSLTLTRKPTSLVSTLNASVTSTRSLYVRPVSALPPC
jgi:hypothetical protein